MIQYPAELPRKCIIIKSNEGVGKNVILSTIANVINSQHYLSSQKTDDFCGKYANGLYRKLLINMNECEWKGTKDYIEIIKSIITDKEQTLEQKFQDKINIDNYCRLIITTNKKNPIKFSGSCDERRFIVFK